MLSGLMNTESCELRHFNPAAHEVASKAFKRTPNGLIFTEDLKRVFSILLICLDLKEKPVLPSRHQLFPAFQRMYPFSFCLRDAISTMANLKLQINMNYTRVSMSYSIKTELACRMLQMMMDAKLLHAPADRTRAELKEGLAIQPTPKGVAVLQRYVRQVGLKNTPALLKSDLNSMELFTFERSSMTDAIIHSDYFVSLLFARMMGPVQNVWSPDNRPDDIPALSKLLECIDDTFSLEGSTPALNASQDCLGSFPQIVAEATGNILNEHRSSPLSHRFFTNPDSTSHVQYYASTCGLRLFNTKTFNSEIAVHECTFSTKAIWQWLMDCTDIMYPKEAVTIASLFLKNGLIKPIFCTPSENHRNRFSIGPKCFFTLTEFGGESVQWKAEDTMKNLADGLPPRSQAITHLTLKNDYTHENKTLLSPSSLEFVSGRKDGESTNLANVLRDPGMRYLFKTHLEKEFCVENLDVFIEIKKFLKRMTVLKNLLETKLSRESDGKNSSRSKHFSDLVISTINHALFRQASECLENAYQIYSSFVAPGSPYQLNIDHKLREAITEVILHPQHSISSDETTHVGHRTKHTDNKAGMTIEGERKSTIRSNLKDVLTTTDHTNHEATPQEVSFASTYYGIGVNDKSEGDFSSILKTLKLIYPLYENVAGVMYQLMEVDSLPKFINSEIYQEAAAMLNFDGTMP
ncbi:LADA_0A00650g1_1 [Lachancea dasiensis]|uniref:LADA_0A00650g1_1 n=1 Tax=Lachancea dasiensis TaxID=1072105 RepID=A0A1G4IM36_9SACH|nr:LADA_0A00650g1_1 [Lachancea dasiensis]